MARRNGVAGGGDDYASQVEAALEEARRAGRSAVALKERAYRMPPVRLGMMVLWSHGEVDAEPCAAQVIAVGDSRVEVKKLVSQHAIPEEATVAHRDDPCHARVISGSEGCWDYTLYDRELMAAFDAIGVPFLDNDAAKSKAADPEVA